MDERCGADEFDDAGGPGGSDELNDAGGPGGLRSLTTQAVQVVREHGY